MSTLCSSIVGATLSVLLFLVSTASADEAKSGSGKLRALQEQKLAILEANLNKAQKDYSEGLVTILDVIRASNQTLKAKLPLAKDKAARLAILKERVDVLQRWHAISMRNYRAGDVAISAQSIQKIQLKKLNAEIALAREQGKS